MVQQILAEPDENMNIKLEKLFRLHSDNGIDAINCFYLLSFINDYCTL